LKENIAKDLEVQFYTGGKRILRKRIIKREKWKAQLAAYMNCHRYTIYIYKITS